MAGWGIRLKRDSDRCLQSSYFHGDHCMRLDPQASFRQPQGLVLPIYVLAKNGILIAEFSDQLREHGEEIDKTIRKAMRLRIRPIMMTMVSTVLGGIPLVLSSSAGAKARSAVGWVIVGSLGFTTLFTLLLTPVFYWFMAILGTVPGTSAKRLENELNYSRSDRKPTYLASTHRRGKHYRRPRKSLNRQ